MKMKINTMLTKTNYTKMTNKQNKYIVIHYVGAVSSAYNNAKYFYSTYRGASAHYFVDDNEIWQVVREGDASWAVGANKYYNDCRNSNSISIEMCCYKKSNGELDVSEATVTRTIELTKELMAKYDIPAENVIRHYDVTHKQCPKPFVKSESRWIEFKNRLSNDYIKYQAHVENIGWQDEREKWQVAGTEGECLRVEAIRIFSNLPITYRVHMADLGWGEYVSNEEIAGTVGESRRIESIEIDSPHKKVKATAHIENIGWQEETTGNHIKIGTEGRALRLEALRLEFV